MLPLLYPGLLMIVLMVPVYVPGFVEHECNPCVYLSVIALQHMLITLGYQNSLEACTLALEFSSLG